ncbi:hypothetical protein E4U54_004444 [Claviceps lovelessii]|nr:hypothetical protein E4U54_004444 [Claviceps lovelessii]
MNPCADDFRPLSTPAIDSSSSVITLDRDAGSSGSAGIRFRTPESDQTYQVIEPLPYDLEQALAPLQIPLFNQATPYSSLPYGFPFGSHQIWSVQPWYNPVVVSGRDCGTSLQPLHDSLSFRPMNTMLAHTSRLQPSTIANPEVVIERPSTIKPAPGRQLEQDPLSKQLNQDELGSNIKRRDLEYLISGLKPLACTASVARGCRIGNSSRGLRKTARKTREKSSSVLGSTQDLCHHGRRRNSDLSVERLSSLPSCASSAGSATSAAPSATSSPPWSDNTLLLMNEGLSSSDVLSLDTLKLPDSLHSFNFSLSDESNSLQKLPHLQNIASSASPQTSPQQQSLLPFEAQQLTELETVKSSEQSSKTLTDLSQGINSLSISDTTVSNDLQSATAINLQPEALASLSNGHCITKNEPKDSSIKTPVQVNSEPCTSTSLRSQHDAQPSTPRLESSRKCFISNSDEDARSNAFSAPTSRGAFGTSQTSAATSSARNATESGSWSQSKRWMSQTSKERMIFQKMVTNLFHLSANNSPFVPQSPAELTAFRAEMADIKKKRLSREVGWRVATMERKRAQSKDSGEQAVKLVPFLLGRQFKDTLSPVFASRNCFAGHISKEDTQWVPWPSLPEFKDEGDKRSSQHGRRFPLPRLAVNSQSFAIVSNYGYRASRQMKTVKIDTRFIHPASDFTDQSDFSLELSLTEYDVPYYLLEAIQAMQEELDD